MNPHSLEWENQRVFLAVLRSGSLSGAARLLGIAQATARRRIEKLEANVGVSLFTRTSSGLVPTEAARDLGEHVEAMDAAARAFNRRASSDADSGTVRLTSSELLGVEILPHLLHELRQRLPQLRLELSIGDRLEALARQESDIAVRLQRPSELDVVTRRVGALQVGLFATAGCLARHGTPQTPAELQQLPLIGPDRRQADHQVLREQGVCAPGQDFAIASDSHLAQLAALRAGLGFALCPVQLAAQYGLVRVLDDAIAFEIDVWIAMHRDLRRIRRVALVFDTLAETLDTFLGTPL